MSWSSAFDDPIPLPAAASSSPSRDAAEYIQKLPKAAQD
jgi:hypothetical protein